jgi:hypothetical protein
LLLAFPLFVVVVGVDPRWLLHSLRQHTAVFQGDRTSDEKAESREDLGWQSTPLNYLEKIFQIPFTLRPISRRGFERLVNAFATQRPGNNQGSLSSQKEPVLPVNESNPQAPTDQTAASSAREIIDRHPEHLRIEEWEQVFMKALYELIPSPRAAKRFINIYRLLRASVEDPERNEFVGNSTGGVYQCALMLLAILTGYPTEATEILEALLKEQPKEKNWGQFLASLREKVRHERPLTTRSISPEIPPLSRWEELLVKIERMKNNLNDRPCEGFVKWAPRVARYSFQSGRVLLRQRE